MSRNAAALSRYPADFFIIGVSRKLQYCMPPWYDIAAGGKYNCFVPRVLTLLAHKKINKKNTLRTFWDVFANGGSCCIQTLEVEETYFDI
jgi:hypothetical protein